MTKTVSASKKPRSNTPEFRQEAPKLAERIGVAAAARELSLYQVNSRQRFRLVCDESVSKASMMQNSGMVRHAWLRSCRNTTKNDFRKPASSRTAGEGRP